MPETGEMTFEPSACRGEGWDIMVFDWMLAEQTADICETLESFDLALSEGAGGAVAPKGFENDFVLISTLSGAGNLGNPTAAIIESAFCVTKQWVPLSALT